MFHKPFYLFFLLFFYFLKRINRYTAAFFYNSFISSIMFENFKGGFLKNTIELIKELL